MSKLRLIQCGVGGFGEGWVTNRSSKSPDFDLVAIVDLSDSALKKAGDLVNIPPERRFKTLEEALEKVPADAVATITPPAVHLPQARLAFARGLHLITEKPIADTIENAKTMIDLARRAGKQLVVSQNYRYRPFIQKLKQLMKDRALGDFGHGHMDFYIPADFTGSFREKMEYPLLVDMAVHHFDLIRCVTGKNITKVTSLSAKPSWSWYAHQPMLKALIELDGGIPFSYSGDWSARGKSTSWNGSWRLQCAEGSMHLEDDKILLARCEKWNNNISYHPISSGSIPLEDQSATLHNFAEAIRTGIPAETSGDDNLYTFAAVTAGLISAKENRAVEVREVLGK